jgi:hypothetical protein
VSVGEMQFATCDGIASAGFQRLGTLRATWSTPDFLNVLVQQPMIRSRAIADTDQTSLGSVGSQT